VAVSIEETRPWLQREAQRIGTNASVPRDLVKIAQELGAEIQYWRGGSEHGRLALRGEGAATIWISDSTGAGEVKARFTIAHEVGHLLLWRKLGLRPSELKSRREYWEVESLCNYFAGKLLVPESILKQARFRHPGDILMMLGFVMKSCKVSAEVAARELVDAFEGLGYWVADVSEKGGSTSYRVKWACGLALEYGLSRMRRIGADESSLIKLVDSSRYRNHISNSFVEERVVCRVKWRKSFERVLVGLGKTC
jgi:hypothetical protein